MLTRAEGKRQKRALDKQRAVALKQAARAKVRELRAALKRARAERPHHVRAARTLCQQHRRLLVRRAKERKGRLLRELADVTRQEREAARARCVEGKQRARVSALSRLEKAKHELHHERAYQADLRRIEANNRAQRCTVGKACSAERRSESDGEVAGNLPPELVPLFERMKRKIKSSTRQSRTEAFLHYAEEHPREVIAAQEHGIDATIRQMEAQHDRALKLAKASPRRRYTPEELAAVPF